MKSSKLKLNSKFMLKWNKTIKTMRERVKIEED